MEEMGGLAKRMPETAFYFLIGAVAISALPPLNGFVSEWLTYQALLQGFGTTDSLMRLIFPLSGAMLALTGALAAACFVKAFGITFLAQPRSEHAKNAHEVAPTMRFGMALLTVGVRAARTFSDVQFIRLLDPLTQQFTGQQISGQLSLANGLVLTSLAEKAGTISTLGLALMGVCLLPIPFGLWLVFARQIKNAARAETWACGQRGLTPQMEYTATGFSKPIRMIFKALFRPRRDVQREYDFSPYFATTIRFESHVEEVFVRRIYRPLRISILRASRRIRTTAGGQHPRLPALHFRHAAVVADVCLMNFNLPAILAQTALLLLLAPLFTGLIKNWKAKLQNRRGPRVWQPYFDLVKFLRKDMVVSEHASWIFSFTPYVLFLTALCAGLLVPMVTAQAPMSLFGDALALVGLAGAGPVLSRAGRT